MKRTEIYFMVLQVPLDFCLLLLAGISAYYIRLSGSVIAYKPVVFHLTFARYLTLVSWVSLVWLVIFALLGLYSLAVEHKLVRDIQRVCSAATIGLSIIALYLMFTQVIFDSRFLVVVGWALAILYLSVGRILLRIIKSALYRVGIGTRRVVIIGTKEQREALMQLLSNNKELGYTVLGGFTTATDEVLAGCTDLDEIIFMNPRTDLADTWRAIDFCDTHHVVFKYSADLFDTYASHMVAAPLLGVPMVELRRTTLDGWGRVLKRLFDIVMSIFMIVVTSPIMLVVAVGILIETGRPIIYKNERIGLREKKFFTLKFRSMYRQDSTGPQFGASGVAAEKRESVLIKNHNSRKGPIYKIANDPRVTPFGRWIRRWSLDELSQFFNVLAGSMSIIGPRPHQPREVDQYKKLHRTVLGLKPGITGLAQVSGRSDLSYDEEMKLDVFYMEHWSILLDVIIFLKTPLVICKRRHVL